MKGTRLPSQHLTAIDPPSQGGLRGARILPGPAPLFFLAILLIAIGVTVVPLTGQQPAQQPAPAQEAAPAAAPADNQPATYVGSETCQACHEDISKAFQRNVHFAIEKGVKGKAREGQACESCHGPGSKHAESVSADDIKQPAKQNVRGEEAICLACHLNQKTNSGRLHGGHARGQVRCTGCHKIHDVSLGYAPRKPAVVNQQCSGCHSNVLAQFQRPHTHPLNQNAMSCVDCHNPHGSVLAGMVKTVNANDANCVRCHGNLRGPFAFEHTPVRVEGCSSCHEPHGSSNPKMLTRHEQRFLCLECHSNIGAQSTLGGAIPAIHNLNSSRFRNCTICHVKIHGSNVNRTLMR